MRIETRADNYTVVQTGGDVAGYTDVQNVKTRNMLEQFRTSTTNFELDLDLTFTANVDFIFIGNLNAATVTMSPSGILLKRYKGLADMVYAVGLDTNSVTLTFGGGTTDGGSSYKVGTIVAGNSAFYGVDYSGGHTYRESQRGRSVLTAGLLSLGTTTLSSVGLQCRLKALPYEGLADLRGLLSTLYGGARVYIFDEKEKRLPVPILYAALKADNMTQVFEPGLIDKYSVTMDLLEVFGSRSI